MPETGRQKRDPGKTGIPVPKKRLPAIPSGKKVDFKERKWNKSAAQVAMCSFGRVYRRAQTKQRQEYHLKEEDGFKTEGMGSE